MWKIYLMIALMVGMIIFVKIRQYGSFSQYNRGWMLDENAKIIDIKHEGRGRTTSNGTIATTVKFSDGFSYLCHDFDYKREFLGASLSISQETLNKIVEKALYAHHEAYLKQAAKMKKNAGPPPVFKNDQNRENEILAAGGWKCTKCGKAHFQYEAGCSCGYNRFAPVIKENEAHKEDVKMTEKAPSVEQSQNDEMIMEHPLKKKNEINNNTSIPNHKGEPPENNDQCTEIKEKYRQIVEKHKLAIGREDDGVKEIFQPDDFCEKAFHYCVKQFGTDDEEGLAMELCLIPYYGCVWSVACWSQDKSCFAGEESVWDTMYRLINVEYVDEHVDRLLKTETGEELSERIYKVIFDYMDFAVPIIIDNDGQGMVSMLAMKQAYSLGMLVAKKVIRSI